MCLVSVMELIARIGRFIRTHTHNIENPTVRGNIDKTVKDCIHK